MAGNLDGIEARAGEAAATWTNLMKEWAACSAEMTQSGLHRTGVHAEADPAYAEALQAAIARSEVLKARIDACIDDALQRRIPAKRPLAIVNLALPDRSPRTPLAGLIQRIFSRKEN